MSTRKREKGLDRHYPLVYDPLRSKCRKNSKNPSGSHNKTFVGHTLLFDEKKPEELFMPPYFCNDIALAMLQSKLFVKVLPAHQLMAEKYLANTESEQEDNIVAVHSSRKVSGTQKTPVSSRKTIAKTTSGVKVKPIVFNLPNDDDDKRKVGGNKKTIEKSKL